VQIPETGAFALFCVQFVQLGEQKFGFSNSCALDI
jgi:hypothetical protein